MNAIYKITHQLLNAVHHNNKLLIVGDKSFVVPVISTLKIFLEGKALELIYWVNTNNYSEFDIAGISPGRFLEVRDEMDLSNFIIIDINNSMVIQDPNS